MFHRVDAATGNDRRPMDSSRYAGMSSWSDVDERRLRRPDRVACSIVASRLDYCNALLSGAPAATLDKLQRAQNNLTRVVCQSRSRTDVRPLLHSLHWLPMRQRVTYEVALLTHSHSNVSQRAGTDPCTTSGFALIRCSAAGRSSHTHQTAPSRFFCCCCIHLELSTC